MQLSPIHNRNRAGFTLAEILLAMLVFAIAITTILALLARSIETVDEIILKDEAMRLSSSVEDYFQKKSFNESYDLIRGNQTTADSRMLMAFHFRAQTSDLSPRESRDGTPGTEYVILPLVKETSAVTSQDLAAREGRLFKIRLTLSPTNPATNAALPNLPDAYASAVLVVYAEFFSVGNPASPVTTLSPVYAYNFAIRR